MYWKNVMHQVYEWMICFLVTEIEKKNNAVKRNREILYIFIFIQICNVCYYVSETMYVSVRHHFASEAVSVRHLLYIVKVFDICQWGKINCKYSEWFFIPF